MQLKAGYTLIAKYAKMGAKFEKRKLYSRVSYATFSVFRVPFSLFAFYSISRQGWHLGENLNDFIVYFFAALIKHEIHLKCKKCIVSVSHFVVCFAKTFAKYAQNMKSVRPA